MMKPCLLCKTTGKRWNSKERIFEGLPCLVCLGDGEFDWREWARLDLDCRIIEGTTESRMARRAMNLRLLAASSSLQEYRDLCRRFDVKPWCEQYMYRERNKAIARGIFMKQWPRGYRERREI